MTKISHDYVGFPVFGTEEGPQIRWPGGVAQLCMRRFGPGYRLSEAEHAALTPDETARLRVSNRPAKTHRGLAARIRLRRMLGTVLGCQPEDVRLLSGADGKPVLHPAHGSAVRELDFSISYVPQGFAVCLAMGRRVGVDMQGFTLRQEANFEAIFGGYWTRRGSTGLEPHEIWARMEAYGKMQGDGLAHGLHKLYRIAIAPERDGVECQFRDFRFGRGIALSLCLSGPSTGPVCLVR